MKKIVVLAPHPDDGELGCGGTIQKLTSSGNIVYYVCLTTCNESLDPKFAPGTLIDECKNATRLLGIKNENLWFLEYEVRKLNYKRQEILEDFIRIQRSINPEIVFMPSSFDTHQDHHVVYEEGFRAFKNCNLFGYDLPWNCVNFSATCFSALTEKQIAHKSIAVSEYKSQAARNYMNDFVRAHARSRGVQSNQQYAEAFEVIRIGI